MARKTPKELQKIKSKYGVDRLWSWSKINCYKTSPFEYFLKYIIHAKEDRDDSAYAPYGTLSHNIMEKFYSNEISYEKMIDEFEDGAFTLELADLKFDRNSKEKNNSIKEKYLYDLRHFFRNHNSIPYKVILEQFLTVKIDKHLFNGYLDCIFKDKHNCYNIVDFKTSSIYKGEKLVKESGQLLLYALGLYQMGVPIEQIKTCWNFLKYSDVLVEQANGKFISRQIERVKIGESLKANCTMWLKRSGYGDEIENYIDLLLKTNDISCLPKDVQEKYKLSDCYVFIDFDIHAIHKLKSDMFDTILEILRKEKMYQQTKDEKIFYDNEDSVKKESFYFSTLCSYSPKLHKPYGLYLDKFNADKSRHTTQNVSKSDNPEDLSWLDEI